MVMSIMPRISMKYHNNTTEWKLIVSAEMQLLKTCELNKQDQMNSVMWNTILDYSSEKLNIKENYILLL